MNCGGAGVRKIGDVGPLPAERIKNEKPLVTAALLNHATERRRDIGHESVRVTLNLARHLALPGDSLRTAYPRAPVFEIMFEVKAEIHKSKVPGRVATIQESGILDSHEC